MMPSLPIVGFRGSAIKGKSDGIARILQNVVRTEKTTDRELEIVTGR